MGDHRDAGGVGAKTFGESECCPEGAEPAQSWWTSGRFALVFGVVVGLVLAGVSVVTSVVVYAWFGVWPWDRVGLDHAAVVQIVHTVLAVVGLLAVVAVVVLVYRKNGRDEREEVLACREVDRRLAHEAAMRERWRAEDARAALNAEAQRERMLREEVRAEQLAFVNEYGAAADQLASEDGTKQLAGLYAMGRLARTHRPEEPSAAADRERTQQCLDMVCAFVRQAGSGGVGSSSPGVFDGGVGQLPPVEVSDSAQAPTELHPAVDADGWPAVSTGSEWVVSSQPLRPGMQPAEGGGEDGPQGALVGGKAGGADDGAKGVSSAVGDAQQAALAVVAGVLPPVEPADDGAVVAADDGSVVAGSGPRGVYVVDVTGANMSGLALAGAAWRKHGAAALVVARGAVWRGADCGRVDISGADFGGARLDDAVLRGTRLVDANLRGASLVGADAEGAVLRGASLVGATLHRANFTDADFRAAQCQEVGLVGANLSGVKAEGADFSGARLVGANVRRAQLVGANFRGAWLVDANLSGARLSGADCTGAGLVGANVRGAQLGGTVLRRAGLAGTDLRGTWLVGADVTGARFVFNVRQEPPVTIAEVAGPGPWQVVAQRQGCCGDDVEDDLGRTGHSRTWHAVAEHARQWASQCNASKRSAAALAAVVARRCDPSQAEPPHPDTPLAAVTAPLLAGAVASPDTFAGVPGWGELVDRGYVDVSAVIWVDETETPSAGGGVDAGGGAEQVTLRAHDGAPLAKEVAASADHSRGSAAGDESASAASSLPDTVPCEVVPTLEEGGHEPGSSAPHVPAEHTPDGACTSEGSAGPSLHTTSAESALVGKADQQPLNVGKPGAGGLLP